MNSSSTEYENAWLCYVCTCVLCVLYFYSLCVVCCMCCGCVTCVMGVLCVMSGLCKWRRLAWWQISSTLKTRHSNSQCLLGARSEPRAPLSASRVISHSSLQQSYAVAASSIVGLWRRPWRPRRINQHTLEHPTVKGRAGIGTRGDWLQILGSFFFSFFKKDFN